MKKLNVIFVILMVVGTIGCSEKIPDPTEIKIGDAYQGGLVFQTKTATQPGLILSVKLSKGSNWDDATQICLNYSIDGFSDWYLPSYSYLEQAWRTFPREREFLTTPYWSSTPMFNKPGNYWVFNNNGVWYKDELYYKNKLYGVIAIREF